MKITTLKQFEFRCCPVIIRRLDKYTFEYLLVLDGQFYGTHIADKLKWWQFYKMFKEEPYSNKEIQAMIHFLTKAAETTIITIRDKNAKATDDKTN